MEAGKELRILIFEGNPTDVGLEEHALRKAGLAFSSKRVGTRDAFARALDEFCPAIVLADHKLPGFDGLSAVKIARQKYPDLPVILLTGALEDEAAIEILKAGASDYILKERLDGLAPAVERALSKAEEFRNRARAEEELRKSQAMLAMAERVAGIGSWEWDIVRNIHLWSEGEYRVLGRVPEAVNATFENFLACVHPDDRKRVQEDADAMLSGSEPEDLEFRIVRSDGAVRIVHARKDVFRDDRGKPLRMVGTIQDITERKRAETALKERVEDLRRFATVVSDSNDAVILHDFEGKILAWNRGAKEAYGYTEAEAVGMNVRDIVAETDREAALTLIQKIKNGEIVKSFELRRVAKDGRILDVWLTTTLLTDEEGNPVAIATTERDITERKRAGETRAQLAAIVESSRSGIIGCNLEGLIDSWNPGAVQLYGYTAAEMIGRPAELLAPADRKHEMREQIERTLRGDGVANFETVRVAKGGRQIDVSETISPIRIDHGPITGAAFIILDVSEKMKSARALEGANRALKALSQANGALVRAQDRDALQWEICQVILDSAGYRLVWIGKAEHDQDRTVRPLAWAGVDSEHVAKLGITWADSDRGRGPTGMAIKTGLPQIVQRVADDPASEPWRAAALERGYKSGIALPLKDRAGVFGALSIHGGEPDLFGPEEVKLLAELADDLSYGIVALQTRAERETAVGDLARSMEDTVQAVASTVEMRDAYTAGHQRRVAIISEAIAAEMRLSPDRIHGLRLACIVHDLGKINIPAEILSKPGKLSALEYELIKMHPQVGYEILKPVKFPWPIADIVLQHHERLDGSGYPNGLKGDAILLEARILAVADVVEAMMSHRPFRPALGLDVALAEIRQGSGRLYDPAVVEACLQVMSSGQLDLGKS